MPGDPVSSAPSSPLSALLLPSTISYLMANLLGRLLEFWVAAQAALAAGFNHLSLDSVLPALRKETSDSVLPVSRTGPQRWCH